MFAKVRSVGWLPWILMLLWGLTAGAGEPLVLRMFGISLQEQSTWAVAAVLAIVLLLAVGGPSHWVARMTTNLGLVVLVAAVQFGQSLGLEAVFGYSASPVVSFYRALHFVIASLPIVAAISTQEIPQVIYRYILTASCAATSLAVGVRGWDTSDYPACLMTIALSVGACLFTVACSTPVAMITIRP